MDRRRKTTLFSLAFALLCGAVGASAADRVPPARPIRVVNPLRLPGDAIPAVRTPLGIPNDYKPWIVQLKNGELLIVAFCFGGTPSNKLAAGQPYLERAVFWRSQDGGKTWGPREERPDIHGREFSLSSLSDGTLIMPCHFLANDAANKAGYTHSKVFRSADLGKTWTETRVGPEGFPEKAQTSTDWTAIEVPDPERPGKTIVQLGVGMQEGKEAAPSHVFLWRSRDSGATWDKSLVPDTDGWIDVDGFFSQSTTYRSASGVLWHPVRVDASGPHWKLPAAAGVAIRSGDQDDRTMLWKSTDNGHTWRRHKDGGRFGTYGEMYPRFLRLHDGRLLLTFTVRSNATDGHPLGLRGLISSDDGETWDFSHDRIVISDRNHGASGGGFGNTIQLPDGALISVYSFRGDDDATHIEAVRWTIPEKLAASSTQPVHPVLIRNDHNVVTRVVIDGTGKNGVRVNGFSFALRSTDDLADLESLALFTTGDKFDFSATTQFGRPVQPAMNIEFHGEYDLHPGDNEFWLSCRLKTAADLSHHISAACTSIDTAAGRIIPRDLSPGVRHRIGVALRRHNDDGVHTYRIPALATTPAGTLLCVYDMRRRMGRDLQEDIDIGLSRSTDGGQTWESPRVIMDMGEYGGLPQEQNGCSDPGIIVDRQTGDIYCFAVWMNGKPGKHQWVGDGSAPGYEIGQSAQFLMVHSKDDGRTWSKPENLTRRLKKAEWWLLAPSPQQGISLDDGTLVMPVQGRDEKEEKGEKEIPFATIMTSRDHGATWTVGAPAYSGGNECQAVQLGDRSIMLNMRNDHERFRAVAVTRDLGMTWEMHETSRKSLIEPNCNGSLLRVDYSEGGAMKHVLLFSNPHSQTARTHQTIQVSFDDGRTWPVSHHRLLDEGRGAGYPSLTRVDDRHVGIVYEGSRAHLVFEKLTIDELLKPAAD